VVITPESDDIVASDLFQHCVHIGAELTQVYTWLEEELFFGLKNLITTAVLKANSISDGEAKGNDLADSILQNLNNEVQAVNIRKVERRQPTALEICKKLFIDPHYSAQTGECGLLNDQQLAVLMSRGFVVMDGFLDTETVLTIYEESSASVGARILAAREESAADAPATAGDPAPLALPPQALGQGSALAHPMSILNHSRASSASCSGCQVTNEQGREEGSRFEHSDCERGGHSQARIVTKSRARHGVRGPHRARLPPRDEEHPPPQTAAPARPTRSITHKAACNPARAEMLHYICRAPCQPST
jgi:hypothetical protein